MYGNAETKFSFDLVLQDVKRYSMTVTDREEDQTTSVK